MSAMNRRALVDAAEELNNVLNLEPRIDVKLGVSELKAQLLEATALLRETDTLQESTRDVVEELVESQGVERVSKAVVDPKVPDEPEDEESEDEEDEESEDEELEDQEPEPESKAPKVAKPVGRPKGSAKTTPAKTLKAAAKPVGRPKVAAGAKQPKATAKPVQRSPRVALGRFEPVRRGSSAFAKILEVYLDGKATTVGGIARAVGVDGDKIAGFLKRARITNGIDHEIDDDGVLSIILPNGVDEQSVWRQTKPKAAKAAKKTTTGTGYKGRAHIDEMYAAANRGVMPQPIRITSVKNTVNQHHLDKLQAFAEADDWDAVRRYHMGGTNTYAKMIRRYQELLLIAHDAQA